MNCKVNYAGYVKLNMPNIMLLFLVNLMTITHIIFIIHLIISKYMLTYKNTCGIIILTVNPFTKEEEVIMPKSQPSTSKLEALREQGTANPHPEKVCDPLFLEGEFFDPHDLIQVKYEMLRRVEKEGATVTDAASAFGFSRPAFYQARQCLGQSGLAGLLPKVRGPKEAHKLIPAVMEFIEQAVLDDPSLRAQDLVGMVRVHFGFSVHPRSIERAMLRHQKKRRRQPV
jgi:hypothetical protein